jgi:hypothetical protein
MPRYRALLAALAGLACTAPGLAQATDTLDEVTVTARKQVDPRRLDHVLIPQFIESHATPARKTGQIPRWRSPVCPLTLGLKERLGTLVSQRVQDVAASVGAPTKPLDKCHTNVQIVFTGDPQKQVAWVAKQMPLLFGWTEEYRPNLSVSRPIQAWYETGTRGVNGDVAADRLNGTPPSGRPGSHLTRYRTSEFVNVLVVVDAGKVAQYPLQSIANYIAMLVLTRVPSLDSCGELASITDLLSSGCWGSRTPADITESDSAYLRALYGSDLEMDFNLERGDIHDRMLSGLKAPSPGP